MKAARTSSSTTAASKPTATARSPRARAWSTSPRPATRGRRRSTSARSEPRLSSTLVRARSGGPSSFEEAGRAGYLPRMDIKLYVIPGSHPCATVEAALDLKSLEYARVDLLPGIAPLHQL